MNADSDMVTEIPASWRGSDDYLASLKAKYRKAALRVAGAIELGGAEVEHLRDPRPHVAELHRLYLQMQERSPLPLATLPPDHLAALVSAGGNAVRLSVVRRGADLCGFVLTIRDGETATAPVMGVDDHWCRHDIYLRLLHQVIADAIALKCRRLSLGRTALEPKARLGAQPVARRVWLRHQHPLLNFVVRCLARAAAPAAVRERRPFKREFHESVMRGAAIA